MKGIKRFHERRFSWWLTFTGEMIFNPKYYDYTAGRIEVYNDNIDTPYAQNEYRIFTKDAKRFYSFIEQHEFKNMTKRKINKLIEQSREFYDPPD